MKRTTVKIPLPPRLESELANSKIVKPQNEYYTRIFHAVNPGDLVAAMGAIKKYYDITGKKVIVCQSVSQLAAYYQGAVHPTVNERGENVCCNDYMWEMLKPLIEYQEYVHSFEKYSGQKIDIDFNNIRSTLNVNLPHGAIQNWVSLGWPDLAFDLSKEWLSVPECPQHIKEQVSGKVILNFTERYRNQTIDYFFLQNYTPDLIFAGTEKEHHLFCSRWALNIPRLQVNDFLELATAIKNARFILANQSMCWNIAQAILSPRILEICAFAENCIHGIGEHSYGFLKQAGAEYYFRKLYNITK